MNGIGRSSSEFRNDAAAAETAATAEADDTAAAAPSPSAAFEFIIAAIEKFVALADLAGGSLITGGDPIGGTPAGKGKGSPAPKGSLVGVAWNKGRIRAGGGPPGGGGAEDSLGDIIFGS